MRIDRVHINLGILNYSLGNDLSQGISRRYEIFRLGKSALLLLPLRHFLPVQLVILQPISLKRAFRIYRELRRRFLILQELPRLGRSSFLLAISYLEIADDGRGRAPLGWAGGRPSGRALLRLALLRFRIDIRARKERIFQNGRVIGARGGVQLAEYRRRSGHRRMELRIWRATGQNRRRFYAVLELLRSVLLGGFFFAFRRWPWSSELSLTYSFIIKEIIPRARLPPCFWLQGELGIQRKRGICIYGIRGLAVLRIGI